jgi:Insertion element 4 transposase N-terminal
MLTTTLPGPWRDDWEMPSPGGLCRARQRLGAKAMRKLYERAAVPCAMRSTKGAWLAGRRLMAVDGFGMEAADSEENAEYFGYAAGIRQSRSCGLEQL